MTVRATDADGAFVDYDVTVNVTNPGPVDPADQTVGATQGVAIHFIAIRKLLLGRQVVSAAVVRAQFRFELCRNFLPTGWVTGRMSG